MSEGWLTMKEYMQKHGIPGSPHDRKVNRAMREHFEAKGWVKVRSGNRYVWMPAYLAPKKVDFDRVEAKLRSLT